MFEFVFSVVGKYLPGSALAAWNLLDLMGASRSSSTLSLLRMLCTKLVSKIDGMKEKEIVDLLTVTYPYIGFVELRPVVLQIMRRCQQIPIPLLQSLNEQLPLLQIKVPVQVMHQMWKFSDKSFIEAINPLVRQYILQAASSWSIRAAQVLHKSRIEEMEQVTMRTSSAIPLSGETLSSFNPFDTIPVCDLDLRQTFLSLPPILISDPSEETLRIVQFESEQLGPSRNAFTSFLDASSPPESQAEAFANLVTMTTSAKENQLKMGQPLNSYTTASTRELNIPLQLLTDYIGDQPQLYASAVRFVRRLMMEIQSYQLKMRPGIEFERQFPLLSSLGVLPLFTITKPLSSTSSSSVSSSSSTTTATTVTTASSTLTSETSPSSPAQPVGVDPMLSQILGSLRFDLLMAQHDRVHTSLCEQDELYRFAWCIDAIRRERAVEQRHYDEMEEIFVLLQTQLAPLKKQTPTSPAPTSSGKLTSAPPTSQSDEKRQTRQVSATKVVIGGKKASSKDSTPTIVPVSGAGKASKAKKISTASSTYPAPTASVVAKLSEDSDHEREPLTRKERSAAARQTIKAALGHAASIGVEDEENEMDEESDEEKKVFSRTRPKRLRSPKPAPSTMDFDDDLDLTDDEEIEKPKRKKKKAKRSGEDSEEEWEGEQKEEEDLDYEDAGTKVDEGDEYVDLSDASTEAEFVDEGVEEDDQEDLYEDDYEYDTSSRKKKAKRSASKSNKGSGKKKTPASKSTGSKASASTTSSASKTKHTASSGRGSGGLKVTLTGLTGTGGLASQAVQRRDVTSAAIGTTHVPVTTGIKLKRGDRVLVDTAAALTGVADPRSAASIATTVVSLELEPKLNFLSECGWILSSGSMQMTIQTILFTILKDAAQKLSKPPSPSHCDPLQDLDTIKKIITSDKRVSRLITLMQLGCFNFPILHASEGLDSPVMIALLAERILESKIVANLLSSSLSAISTKPWTRKNVSPDSLNIHDRFINVLSAIVISTAYTERFEARNASKEAIKIGDDEAMIENEEKRLETMLARSKRHQQASGDLAPDIKRSLIQALDGTDELKQADDLTKDEDDDGERDAELVQNFFPNTFHPDASMSLTLFWTLTQVGSANENVANAISQWITGISPPWGSKDFVWSLQSYPTFIQEILFGFARAGPTSPVLALRQTMVDNMLAGASAASILTSCAGVLQLLSYLYLALTCNSISRKDAQQLHSLLQERLRSAPLSSSHVGLLFDAFSSAIAIHMSDDTLRY